MIVSAEYHRTTGLGNKLFPWSRAKIFAHENNCKMVAPTWFAPRGAAIIRGGVKYSDLMQRFWLLKNFISDPNELSRIEYYRKYQKFEKCCLDSLDDARQVKGDSKHYIFKAIAAHNFSDLQPYRSFVYQRLLAITAPTQKRFINQFADRTYIGLHIRTGKDFVSKSSGKVGFFLTELEWFVYALDKIRSKYGDLPALIVSDGGEKQLKLILSQKNVSLVASKTAIADILILAKSKVLIGSGNSSFSAWSSFLGGMDTYSSNETPYERFKINTDNPEQIIDSF